jgi:hypothetical protein
MRTIIKARDIDNYIKNQYKTDWKEIIGSIAVCIGLVVLGIMYFTIAI